MKHAIAVLLIAATALAQQPHEHDHAKPPAKPAPPKDALRLEDLERMALAASPALAQAGARVDAAAGRAHQAGLWPNPVFGASGEHVSQVTRGGAIGGYVEQRIVTGSKLALSKKIAGQEQAELEQHRAAERQRLLNTVRTLYYQALGDQMLIEAKTDLADLAKRSLAISRELANIGQADQPDLLAAEVEAERVELDLIAAQNARHRTWRQLAAALAQPAMKPVALAGDLDALPDLDADQALETIYRESPELRAAEAAVKRSEFAIKRAEAEKIPDVMLRGGLRNNRENALGLEGIFDAGIAIPIFNRNQGGVKAARAEAEHSRLDLQRTRLALQARLAAAYKEYRDARVAAERYQTRMLPKAREAYEMHLMSYRQMASAYPKVLAAQRTVFDLQDRYVSSLVSAWRRAVEIQGLLLTAPMDE